jgi:hypothetical protein
MVWRIRLLLISVSNLQLMEYKFKNVPQCMKVVGWLRWQLCIFWEVGSQGFFPIMQTREVGQFQRRTFWRYRGNLRFRYPLSRLFLTRAFQVEFSHRLVVFNNSAGLDGGGIFLDIGGKLQVMEEGCDCDILTRGNGQCDIECMTRGCNWYGSFESCWNFLFWTPQTFNNATMVVQGQWRLQPQISECWERCCKRMWQVLSNHTGNYL